MEVHGGLVWCLGGNPGLCVHKGLYEPWRFAQDAGQKEQLLTSVIIVLDFSL